MEFLNKRTQYTAVNVSETLELQGELTFNEQTNEINMNGFIHDLVNNASICNFYYAQRSDGKIDKSITNVEKKNEAAAFEFLNATLVDIYNELNI